MTDNSVFTPGERGQARELLEMKQELEEVLEFRRAFQASIKIVRVVTYVVAASIAAGAGLITILNYLKGTVK